MQQLSNVWERLKEAAVRMPWTLTMNVCGIQLSWNTWYIFTPKEGKLIVDNWL